MNNPIMVEATVKGVRKTILLSSERAVLKYIYEELPPKVVEILKYRLHEVVIKNEVLKTEIALYQTNNEILSDVLQETLSLVEIMIEDPSKTYYLQDIKSLIKNNM